MRMVCGVVDKCGFATNGERILTRLPLELGILVQECLKGLDFLTHSLQVDQKVRPGYVRSHLPALRLTCPSQQSTSSLHTAGGALGPSEKPPDCV